MSEKTKTAVDCCQCGNETAPCVLIGTYRVANEDWILQKSLYNLPLRDGVSPAQYAHFNFVVLYAQDRRPISRMVEFLQVVDANWLKDSGYVVSDNPHASKYVLFKLGESVSVSRLFANPQSDVFVVSARCYERIDAEFYERPLPSCGGRSMPNIFERIRPYFTKWHKGPFDEWHGKRRRAAAGMKGVFPCDQPDFLV